MSGIPWHKDGYETKGEIRAKNKRLRTLNAELLKALERMVAEYGRQNEDTINQAEMAILKARGK